MRALGRPGMARAPPSAIRPPNARAYRSNPTSFEAKAAVELALQRAARVAADNAQAAAELAAGPCKDDRPG